MKRLLLITVVIISVFLFSGCGKTDDNISEEVWTSINSKEFSTDNGWAGAGIYFYEENNEKYCLFMLYGSGVPVAGYDIIEIEIKENGDIVIMDLLDLTEDNIFLDNIIDPDNYIFYYSEEVIMFGDSLYEESTYPMHEYVFNETNEWQ